MKKLLLLVVLLGCSPGAGYVKADRLTHNAIAGDYAAYVGSDASLSAEEKQRRQALLDSWEARIASEEGE